MVHLIAEALLKYNGSGHRAIEKAIASEEIEANQQTVFGKPGRLLVALDWSTGLAVGMYAHEDGDARGAEHFGLARGVLLVRTVTNGLEQENARRTLFRAFPADEASDRRLLAQVLGRTGFTAAHVPNGEH
ncbi:hypothetical protein GC176_23045 [bacterium]|nr:hypothetical protein [bacterium]